MDQVTMTILMLVVCFGLMYFLTIRPQKKKEEELKQKAQKIASKVKRRAQNPHASLKGKTMFYMFRKMQSSPDAAWNPKDRDWWIEQGGIENVRPWK